jgi:hypothetical protein
MRKAKPNVYKKVVFIKERLVVGSLRYVSRALPSKKELINVACLNSARFLVVLSDWTILYFLIRLF